MKQFLSRTWVFLDRTNWLTSEPQGSEVSDSTVLGYAQFFYMAFRD